MTVVHIAQGDTDAVVTFAYDPDVVELVKSLPRGTRRWDPDRKHWIVLADYVQALTTILRMAGHRPMLSGAPRQRGCNPPPPRESPRRSGWADMLLEAVGPARVDPVHRALSRVLHPDAATGDQVLMTELNVARDKLAVSR